MTERRKKSARALGSDLARVDSHVIQRREYDELPELTDAMLAKGVLKRAGRPISEISRKPVSLRLPPETLARWKATGRGWQTRMVALLSKRAPKETAQI